MCTIKNELKYRKIDIMIKNSCKIFMLAMSLFVLVNASYAHSTNINAKPEIKSQETQIIKDDKAENKVEKITGAAEPVEKFEYDSCENEQGIPACKVEDLIKEKKQDK